MNRVLFAALLLLCGSVAGAAELELAHGEDALSRSLPAWRETSLRAAWSRSGTGAGAMVRRVERFDREDWELAAAAYAPLGSRWTLGLEGSGSATHHVIPAWSAGARAQYSLARGLVTSTGLRWSRYEDAAVSTGVAIGNVGLEYYRGAHRFAWTTFVSRVEGEHSASHAAAWEVFFRARDRAGVVLSAGRELESIGGGRVLATDVLGAAIVGRTGLAGAWSLTYGLHLQRQGELYSRSGGRLGLVREF
jgi:YaiO family outer membrane protein